MRRADEVFLSATADRAEKTGNLKMAWKVVAELAYSKPPRHPIHARLAAIETRLKDQIPQGSEIAFPVGKLGAPRAPETNMPAALAVLRLAPK